nr:DUF6273 domain-containing protein [Acholeplasmatales bacterium]
QEFYDRQQTILQGDYTKQAYYWFKFEEILWDIYDISDDGMISLISDDVIDSQSFDWSNNELEFEHNGGTSYGCDYAYSDIRLWLNNNFYNQVFTDVQKELITTTTFGVEGDYTTGTVEDYVGILDYNTLDSCELTSTLSGTAYSLIQGYKGLYYWCTNPFQNYLVRNNTFSTSRISDASIGVRPAITVLM